MVRFVSGTSATIKHSHFVHQGLALTRGRQLSAEVPLTFRLSPPRSYRTGWHGFAYEGLGLIRIEKQTGALAVLTAAAASRKGFLSSVFLRWTLSRNSGVFSPDTRPSPNSKEAFSVGKQNQRWDLIHAVSSWHANSPLFNLFQLPTRGQANPSAPSYA